MLKRWSVSEEEGRNMSDLPSKRIWNNVIACSLTRTKCIAGMESDSVSQRRKKKPRYVLYIEIKTLSFTLRLFYNLRPSRAFFHQRVQSSVWSFSPAQLLFFFVPPFFVSFISPPALTTSCFSCQQLKWHGEQSPPALLERLHHLSI